MSHGCAGRPSGRLLTLRPPSHFLQLLPQSPLSQVPGLRLLCAVAEGTPLPSCCTVEVLPRRLHPSFPNPIGPLALQNQRVIYGLLFRSCGQILCCRLPPRSQASGGRHRVSSRVAHVGTESAFASSCSLRRSRWRHLLLPTAGSGLPAGSPVLPASPCSQSSLSRQVPRSPSTGTPSASTRLLFNPRAHVATA